MFSLVYILSLIFSLNACTTVAAPVASSTSSSASASATSSSLDTYSDAKGIAFSQYTNSGSCKSESELATNFEAMQNFSTIRLYNTDCNLVEIAMKYKKANQTLLIGIYDPLDISNSVNLIKTALNGTNATEHIEAITLGNEHVNDGKHTATEMVNYLGSLKKQLTDSFGYNGHLSIVDTFNAIESNPVLCTTDDSSFVTANAHPFFSGVEASTAGDWLQSTISTLNSACHNKSVLISESGWPTKGNSIGSAVPSLNDQASALKSLVGASIAKSVILFSGWNEMWKQPGSYNVENYWGINQSGY